MNKIGFCCKYSEIHPTKGVVSVPNLNTGTTTVAWLSRQTKLTAENKLWELMTKNLASTYNLVNKIGKLNDHLRLVRISSDLLTCYTHPDWKYFYHLPEVEEFLSREFNKIGELARRTSTRLSFHPGQFCSLASDNPITVANSIDEFEYHADMVRYMGYGKSFQDFKINVHISGRTGANGIRQAYYRLSPEARNCITIENEEMAHGLDECLELSDIIPIVLDIHHHFINTGEYISPNDDRVQRVVDSWRGVIPVCHYSVSREDLLVNHCPNTLPDLTTLLSSGYNKQKLRAHSDYYWNNAVNDWARGFSDQFDICCESKAKNLASFKLFEQWNA